MNFNNNKKIVRINNILKYPLRFSKYTSMNFDSALFFMDDSYYELLQECKSLESVNFSNNDLMMFDNRSLQNIAIALKGLPKLRYLNLSGNQLGWLEDFTWNTSYRPSSNDLTILGELFAFPNLEELDLSNNELNNLSCVDWHKLGQSFSQCNSLTTLNFSNNNLSMLTAEQWNSFGQAISQCKTLRTINLQSNELHNLWSFSPFYFSKTAQWKDCISAVSKSVSLRKIDVDNNKLTPQRKACIQRIIDGISVLDERVSSRLNRAR